MINRIIVGLSTLALSLALPTIAEGQSSRKVKRLEQQRGDLLRKIDKTNKELQKVKKTSQEESKRLELVRQQVAQRREVIAVIGEELESLQGQIDSLGGRITTLRSRESRLVEQYAHSLRQMQRAQSERQRLLFLFASKDVEELRQRQHFLTKYAQATSQAAHELRNTRKEIERTQAEVNKSHEQKAEVLSIRNRERQALEVEEGKRNATVQSLKGQEKKLSQDLQKQKRQSAQLEAQIQAQIAAEIAAAEKKAQKEREAREARAKKRAERRRRAQEAVRRNTDKRPGETPPSDKPSDDKPIKPSDDAREEAEDKEAERSERKSAISGGYAMDANERKLSGSFSQNKGRLPMPVRGRYELVRRFGVQQHDELSRISISNGGIDLRVSGDRGAYSVFDGVVSRIFMTSGYGQSVIVRHGNYLTVYANLSSVRVSSGQRISAGTQIGTISADDSSGRGNTLHFQLWHERNKQNPSSWLRR